MPNNIKRDVEELLRSADIRVNGDRPWDMQVYDERLWDRLASHGLLGAGEAYMEGWWDAQRLDELVRRFLQARLEDNFTTNLAFLMDYLKYNMLNLQTFTGSKKVIEEHYDIGNDLYEMTLDKRLLYTCAYWKNAKTLDEAQEAKLDLICKKIGLKKGDKILDIGCGWGGFAHYAAQKYGAEVVGITLSKEQASMAKEVCKGLPVEIRIQDYRHVNEKFDHIVAVGVMEHVGKKNYKTFMDMAHQNLREGGFLLVQTIGQNASDYTFNPWLNKYIFPNSELPTIKEIGAAVRKKFVMEDWHNFGAHYDATLMAWHQNFEENWDKLKHKYDERFARMWKYYLLTCAGAFRARKMDLWQIVLSKDGIPGGYHSIR